MLNRSIIVLIGVCMLALSGCRSVLSCDDGRDVVWFSSSTEHMLNNGIKYYEDGSYAGAMALLQRVADSKKSDKEDRVTALKYLAFIHCISDREKMCSDSFKKALELKPSFALTPAEAGHPVWGPVFASLKNKPAK